MIISEKDIFDYIYYRDTLTEEKIVYIEGNQDVYKDLINFYREIKDSLQETIPASFEKELETLFSSRRTVVLNPVRLTDRKDKVIRLAAGSSKEEKSPRAVSFADQDAKYIVRALFFPEKTELFVLTSEQRVLKNFSIITKPSLNEYQFIDNSHSIIINEKVIEQVEIIQH